MPDFENILLEVDAERAVALITINRPDKLNALSRPLLEDLSAAVDAVAADERVRAVIVTGAGGKAFVAGADIAEISALEGVQAGVEYSRFGQTVMRKLEQMPKPVIMAINGYALGGGCELALCGDIRIAADSAQIGQPEINLGVIPGFGGTQRLARLVGRDRAKLLVFTGERVGAEEAYQLGIVDRVVPAASLMDSAYELAATLAAKAPRALALAKAAISDGIDLPLDEALQLEADLFGMVVDTEDRREGTSAFLEKRQAQWSGR
ncbi:MAG TPA: enoyl-CoA hydratase-related protein [Chloroflexia bacterium]|nr:enoyl-CoA hydratase-related protein [Chloroflexia bacterium]